jgi:hypothetical protein
MFRASPCLETCPGPYPLTVQEVNRLPTPTIAAARLFNESEGPEVFPMSGTYYDSPGVNCVSFGFMVSRHGL